jgi:hypothetical protein
LQESAEEMQFIWPRNVWMRAENKNGNTHLQRMSPGDRCRYP